MAAGAMQKIEWRIIDKSRKMSLEPKWKENTKKQFIWRTHADIEEMDGYVLPKSSIKVLTFSVIVWKGASFGGWLGQEGGALRIRIGAFKKETGEKSSENILSVTQEAPPQVLSPSAPLDF